MGELVDMAEYRRKLGLTPGLVLDLRALRQVAGKPSAGAQGTTACVIPISAQKQATKGEG